MANPQILCHGTPGSGVVLYVSASAPTAEGGQVCFRCQPVGVTVMGDETCAALVLVEELPVQPPGAWLSMETATPVPEPGSTIMLCAGLLCLAFWRRLR